MGRPQSTPGPGRALVGELVTRLARATGDEEFSALAAKAGISVTSLTRLRDAGTRSPASGAVRNAVEAALPVPKGLLRLVDAGKYAEALALDFRDPVAREIAEDVLRQALSVTD